LLLSGGEKTYRRGGGWNTTGAENTYRRRGGWNKTPVISMTYVEGSKGLPVLRELN
jgi:hypothetical protein